MGNVTAKGMIVKSQHPKTVHAALGYAPPEPRSIENVTDRILFAVATDSDDPTIKHAVMEAARAVLDYRKAVRVAATAKQRALDCACTLEDCPEAGRL